MPRIRKEIRNHGSKRQDGGMEYEPRPTSSVQQISFQNSNIAQCQRLKVKRELHTKYGTWMEVKKIVAKLMRIASWMRSIGCHKSTKTR